jgi:hypothetical protein
MREGFQWRNEKTSGVEVDRFLGSHDEEEQDSFETRRPGVPAAAAGSLIHAQRLCGKKKKNSVITFVLHSVTDSELQNTVSVVLSDTVVLRLL